MDSIEFLEPHNLLDIKSEKAEDLEALVRNLPAQFEGLVDKPSKCGDIFSFNEGRYLFCCSFCEKNFEKIENFIKHVEEHHLKLVEESISLPQEENGEKPSPQLDGSEIRDNDVAIDTKVEAVYAEISNLASSPPSPISQTSGNVQSSDDWEPDSAAEQDSESEKSDTEEKSETVAENNKQDAELTCEISGKKCYTNSGLKKHRSKYHPAEYPDSEPKSRRKMKPRKPTVEKIFKCNYCDRTFKYNSKLVAHERTHTGEAPFQCSACMKCFRVPFRLKQHQLTHTGERPHKCTHCSSAFSCRSNLLCHMRSHLGDKRYKCDECGKGFITSTCLKTHIRSHTGERPYQCEQCGIKCTTASALSFHKKQRHLKYKNHECQICGKRFLTGAVLRGHMRTHSDERPFECSICSATFRDPKSFTAHLKLHSDVKEYVCKICGKEFAQGPGLYSHMKSHGINKTFKEPSETLNSDVNKS